jgi:biotin operon repressor
LDRKTGGFATGQKIKRRTTPETEMTKQSAAHADPVLKAAYKLLILHQLRQEIDLNAYPRQQLADALGVHRITLWRYLQDLDRLVVDVETVRQQLDSPAPRKKRAPSNH